MYFNYKCSQLVPINILQECMRALFTALFNMVWIDVDMLLMMQVNLSMNAYPMGCNRSAQNTFYLTFKHSLWVRKHTLLLAFSRHMDSRLCLQMTWKLVKQANLIIDSAERASKKSQPTMYSGNLKNSIKEGDWGCAHSQEVSCRKNYMAHETAFYTDVTFIGWGIFVQWAYGFHALWSA